MTHLQSCGIASTYLQPKHVCWQEHAECKCTQVHASAYKCMQVHTRGCIDQTLAQALWRQPEGKHVGLRGTCVTRAEQNRTKHVRHAQVKRAGLQGTCATRAEENKTQRVRHVQEKGAGLRGTCVTCAEQNKTKRVRHVQVEGVQDGKCVGLQDTRAARKKEQNIGMHTKLLGQTLARALWRFDLSDSWM
eukprot:1144103-Pelagomonas_calceolata.AAC.8